MNGTVLYIPVFCVGIYVTRTIILYFIIEKCWVKSDRLYLCKAIIAINQKQEKNHNYQQRLQ
jgi:hypothetical protein